MKGSKIMKNVNLVELQTKICFHRQAYIKYLAESKKVIKKCLTNVNSKQTNKQKKNIIKKLYIIKKNKFQKLK